MAKKNKPTQRAFDVGPTAAVGPQRPGARPSWTSRLLRFQGRVSSDSDVSRRRWKPS